MKTALVTTTYLDTNERFFKTVKFVRYYGHYTDWDIVVLDNCSDPANVNKLRTKLYRPFTVLSYSEHHGRPSHLDYLYLWRAVYTLKDLFQFYDKIVYMDNDFYILSKRMFDYVDALESGWTTFWTPTYNMPETGCHVLVKGCAEYERFVASGNYREHNNRMMETLLPVTHVDRTMIGDRFGEFSVKPAIDPNVLDFWAQASLDDHIGAKPVCE